MPAGAVDASQATFGGSTQGFAQADTRGVATHTPGSAAQGTTSEATSKGTETVTLLGCGGVEPTAEETKAGGITGGTLADVFQGSGSTRAHFTYGTEYFATGSFEGFGYLADNFAAGRAPSFGEAFANPRESFASGACDSAPDGFLLHIGQTEVVQCRVGTGRFEQDSRVQVTRLDLGVSPTSTLYEVLNNTVPGHWTPYELIRWRPILFSGLGISMVM